MSNDDNDGDGGLGDPAGHQGAPQPPGAPPNNVVLVDRRPAVTTDLTPYQGAFEPTSREGLSIWGETSKVPSGWTFPGATTDNRVILYDAIRDFLETCHICVHRVPTLGTGAVETNSKLIAGKLMANYSLSKYIDVLAEHARTKKLKKDHLLKWSNWIFGDNATLFELPPRMLIE